MNKEITPYSPMSETEEAFLHRLLEKLKPEDAKLVKQYTQTIIDKHVLKSEGILLKQLYPITKNQKND